MKNTEIMRNCTISRDKLTLELEYFSFYIVEEKKHEREIETIMIRAAGPLLVFNEKKKRNSIDAGDIKDYEAGTMYYERHWKKGKQYIAQTR